MIPFKIRKMSLEKTNFNHAGLHNKYLILFIGKQTKYGGVNIELNRIAKVGLYQIKKPMRKSYENYLT